MNKNYSVYILSFLMIRKRRRNIITSLLVLVLLHIFISFHSSFFARNSPYYVINAVQDPISNSCWKLYASDKISHSYETKKISLKFNVFNSIKRLKEKHFMKRKDTNTMSNKKAADSVHLQLTNMLDVNRTEEERLHIIDIFEVYDPTDRNKTIIVIDDNSKNILAFFSHVYGKNLSELVIANKKLDIQCNENKTYLMDYWTQGKLLSKSSIFPYNQSLMRKSFETYLKSHSKRVKNLLKDLLNKNEIEDFLKFRNISGYNYSEFYYNELLTLDESIKKLKIFLSWFREEFPYYRNKCDRCLTSGEFAGSVFPYEGELEYLASITEMYVCDKCESFSRFPRFNAVGKVLQTRKGRCGEYSSLIVRMLNVLNYKTRLVTDITDHLWGEANIHGNWYHIDPCEAAINEPYIYQGWGKNQTYILAFDTEINCTLPIEDVTSKYTTDIDGIHYRRNLDNMTTEKMNNLIQQEITNLRI